MAFKYFVAFYLISVASAGYIPAAQVYHAAPTTVLKNVSPLAFTAEHVLAKSHEQYDPHPQYKYGYDVQDSISGDSKSHVEERDGDVVHGEYSLIDSDGYKRTVQYTADPIHGFQAEVHREPLAHYAQPTVVKSVAPVAHYAQPTYVKTVAPVDHYSSPSYVKTVQPVAHYSPPTIVKHIAPVTHYSSPSIVKHVAPVTHYSSPSIVKHVAPVTHYSSPALVKTVSHQPVYTSYSAPASYVTAH